MDVDQQILLRRELKVFLPAHQTEVRPEFVASFARNLQTIGFTLSPDAIERLSSWSPEQLLTLAKKLVPQLLKMVGGNVAYRPMYPNFPGQVMEASEAELYINAMTHYFGDWIGERLLPRYEKDSRAPLPEALPSDLRIIQLGTDRDLIEICQSLLSTSTSLSQTDQQDLKDLLHLFKDDLPRVLPDQIPFKEVAAVVTAFMVKNVEDPAELLTRYLRTATDVLRLATEICGGDTSLAKPTRFKKVPRKIWRLILGALDAIQTPLEDMNRHHGKWLRLGECLHPGEYSSRFPNAHSAFSQLRTGESPKTLASTVESLLREKQFLLAAKELRQRPGDFARRLDHLLRNAESDSTTILELFQQVAHSVSTPVLFQLIAHFRFRATDQRPRHIADLPEKEQSAFFDKAMSALTKAGGKRKKVSCIEPMRTVFPKGQTAKLVRVPAASRLIAPDSANQVVKIAEDSLVERFAKLEPLGKCYLAPEMAKFMIPFAQRSASKSLRTVSRGSRMPLPDASTVRFFMWWKEGKIGKKETGRVDLDLSATIYDSNWKYLSHISYTKLRSKKFGCTHSGDITSAPNGACEFIDIDLGKVREMGGRYVLASVQSFTTHPFCDLPECFVGWMARNQSIKGEVFEPATVRDKIDLASDLRISIPMLVDLAQDEIVWADLALKSRPDARINIESNRRGLVHYGVGISELVKPNLFDLFSLHIRARGSMVESMNDADMVFSIDDGVTPFSFDQIISDYLV